jgi:hypothetical protein
MDLQYIQQQRIVERYLSGEITVREAREFEKFCLANPDVLQEMPIPVRLKARLARAPHEHSETGMFPTLPSSGTIAAAEGFDADENEDEAEDDSSRLRPGSVPSKGLIYVLLAGIVLLAGSTVFYGMRTLDLADELRQVRQSMQRTQLLAPSSVQTYKVLLENAPVPPTKSIHVGWPDPPQLLELHFDTSQHEYTQYQIIIQKRDDARLLVLRRVARDSNKDLRLALNSTAFGPGVYLFRVDGYTWRGQLEPVGTVSVDLE